MEIMLIVAIIGILAALVIPSFIRARARSSQTSCINNLRQIESAKSQWALANKAAANASPSDADLFGVTLYIKTKPQCPAGGVYTVDKVNVPATCDQPGHVLD